MTRFNTIELNNATGTVEAGSGVTWDQAYATLNSTGFNIIGGRVPGVGISGLTLGGGGRTSLASLRAADCDFMLQVILS